jgi:hypothetical protein
MGMSNTGEIVIGAIIFASTMAYIVWLVKRKL